MQPNDGFFLIEARGNVFQSLAFAAVVGGPNPVDHAVFGEEGVPTFDVAVPEFLLGKGSPKGSSDDPVKGNPMGVVEPNKGIDARLDEGANPAVVSIDDPVIASEGLLDLCGEFFVGGGGPVWAVEEGIEFDVLEVSMLGEPSGEGGFA